MKHSDDYRKAGCPGNGHGKESCHHKGGEEHHHDHDGCCSHHHGGHSGHHHEGHGGTKGRLRLIVVGALLLVSAVLVEKFSTLNMWQLLLVYLIPYLTVGWGTLKEAGEGIVSGDIFNENFLMSIATIGALSIGLLCGEHQYPEAVFVMLFFQVGELFEEYAEGKSRASIAGLMDIRPDAANVEREGEIKIVPPDQVAVGETIVIKPGEKVPLDGIVVEGNSSLNTVVLTGESIPRDIVCGDEVISGCINLSGVLRVRTTKDFGGSTVSKIIDLVENASERKSSSEHFIGKFARLYTPIVVFAAVALAFVPPFFYNTYREGFVIWLYRALMFLIVSCPCALVLSVPLSFFGGIGGASRKGILVKGSNYLEALAKVDTVVFDKTGTLTHGQFSVEAVHPERCNQHQLLHLAAHVEHFSTHPIAAALRDAFPEEATDGCSVVDVQEVAGQGIRARVQGAVVCVGNSKMMDAIGTQWHDCKQVGTIIHVAIDGEYAGHIVISDRIKDDSADTIRRLKQMGVSHTVMLTGDRKAVGEDVARRLAIDEYYAELLPADKVSHVERLLKEKAKDTSLIFVGDGINDAPVLARADVGIAMGGLGSDAAIEAADVVLMDDRPAKIATAIGIARSTIRIVHENVCFAIGIKVLILVLAATGNCTMWLAVFGDVGVTVLAVLNAMRTLGSSE